MDQAIPWWQSRVILAALVSAVTGALAMTGHNIDAGTQANIVTALADVAQGVSVIAAISATYYRTQVTAPIKGSAIAAQATAAQTDAKPLS